jgi:very-short-patch-repair endonuclease
MLETGITVISGDHDAGVNDALVSIARRQLALLTREQALREVTTHQLRHLIRSGSLELVRRSVCRVAGAPESWEQSVLAACLAVPGAVASFRAAAALWQLEGFERDGIEITVPERERRRLAGVTVHDSCVDGPLHRSMRGPVPVTSVERTLCDLTAVTPQWQVEHAVDEALRRKLATLARLRAVAHDLAGPGRRRSTVMRDILEQRAPGYHPGESAPEKRVADLLVRAGLPEPVRQHWVKVGNRRYRIDLCYPEQGIAIEYDGWDHHKGRQAFDHDRARANDLVVTGLTVLRFTSKSGDQTIVDTVAAALARACVASGAHDATK